MTQEELKLVLDALKWCHGGEPCGTAEAIAVVEKALAQQDVQYTGNGTAGREADVRPTAFFFQMPKPEQEPVAMVESVATVVSESGNQEVTMSWWHEPALPVGTKLYTTPPQRTWVGLTDEEIDLVCVGLWSGGWRKKAMQDFTKAIEAKLKEKNT